MTIPAPWKLLRDAVDRTQNERWLKLVQAAANTPYYSSGYGRALLDSLTDPSHLSRVDPVHFTRFFSGISSFRNQQSTTIPDALLHSPWGQTRKVVAVRPWFPIESRVDIVHQATAQAVIPTRPEVVTGSVEGLCLLARDILATGRRIDTLAFGVIVFTGIGQPIHTARHRDLFWEAFQTPVLEQLRGFQGELLAEECEAHDGFHVNPQEAHWEQHGPDLLLTSLANLRHPVLRLITGLAGRLETSLCACGIHGARLQLETGYTENDLADVAELADALDLGSSARKGMGVRLSPSAPNRLEITRSGS